MLTKLRMGPKLENEGLAMDLIRQLAISTGPQVIEHFISAGVIKWETAFLFEIKTTWLNAFIEAHDQNWAVKSHPMGELSDAN